MRGLWRVLVLAVAVVSAPALSAAPVQDSLPSDGVAWVEEILQRLTLEQKAAQLVMVRSFGQHAHPRSEMRTELRRLVSDLGVGGVVVFDSDLESIPSLLADLQRAAVDGPSEVPLLVASDLERGLSFRVRRGSVPLPTALAVGATGSAEAARFYGEVTAREARAVGIHWVFAPVADINSNPANPVIHVRSFGEDPGRVGDMVAAFVEGARGDDLAKTGVMTSAKHFPGHGDTAVDSHVSLPTLEVDRARLDAMELVPFRRAIEAGVDSVMLGHVSVPSLDPSRAPATLSRSMVTDLLRHDLGFGGLVVTDAIEMAALDGVAPGWDGGAAVAAVIAGADVVLLPKDTRAAVQALARAVREGQLTEGRLDASVRRVLEAKARLGLHRDPSPEPRLGDIARPEDLARAAEMARESVTLVRDRDDLVPLPMEEPLRLLHVAVTGRSTEFVSDALEARGVDVVTRRLGWEVSEATAGNILARAPKFTHIVVSSFGRTPGAELSSSALYLLKRLMRLRDDGGPPVILLGLGSPYLLAKLPGAPTYLCTYGSASTSQEAAVAALLGETAVGGRLPVTLPGLYPSGHGLDRPRRDLTLGEAPMDDAAEDPMAEVDRLLEGFVAEGAFPGAVLAVGHRGRLVHHRAYGRLSYDDGAPAVEVETRYDLASLTKVIATTTMAMILVDEGRLDLDLPVRAVLPRFEGPGKEAVTVRHLLTHASGVDWWAPLYEELEGKDAYLERIQAMDLVAEPGTVTRYSDLGVMLLGEVLERVAGEPLDAFVERRVFGPLGMGATGFLPNRALWSAIAPTERDPWRGRVLQGEVHDENAHALGGVAPHAGLFGTAGDLSRFAQMLLWGGAYDHHRLVSRPTVEAFTSRAGVVEGSDRALGWDTRSATGSSAGGLFSPDSFGHTGFTGTSMWIDPKRELFVVLLTNRVHPTRENRRIRQVRPAVHDAVVRALGLVEKQAGQVEVGLDRLASGDADVLAQLEGRRLGLVAHAASLTADGRHAIDVLRGLGLDLVRLFGPEHGLRGRAAAGESVDDGVDPRSGLPVVSLYGARRAPSPEDLADLDALVFDLQGAGVRFYTYVSTLLLCLDAAAEAGLPLVVLDRPNPLGGERIEGPVSAPRDEVAASFLNMAPGPLVHGLTLGEMARYANARRERPVELRVVPMGGWRRSMTWFDTGLPWTAPSPNLRSPEAALVYPGVAFLEATNVSEGRGTEAPFLRVGAPWLDGAADPPTVPGVELTPTRFEPKSSPAAPSPKHLWRTCDGWRLNVTDPKQVEPYRLGLTLLKALSTHPEFTWRDRGEALTRLLGTPAVLEALERGDPVDDVVAADVPGHREWREARRSSLLYPE
ncbi:MAG: glycoside hydrolase family 3 N-terminal domain-containing protein [Acidobacteriota bacterium]